MKLGVKEAIVLWGLAVAWNVHQFEWLEVVRHEDEIPRYVALPRPEVVKLASMGFAASLADLYWIGASHYFGEPRNRLVNYAQLHEYIDIVNELAPSFKEAYHFGGAAIPWNTGKEWVNADYAVAILRRGFDRFPHDWPMSLLLSYDLGTYLGDFRSAGQVLRAAADEPGAPPYFKGLAARYEAKGGDLEGAREITNALLATAEDEGTRDVLLKHKAELQVEADLQELETAVRQFQATHAGHPPASPSELEAAHLLPRPLPTYLDPAEALYAYDATTGEFRSVNFERFTVYSHPTK